MKSEVSVLSTVVAAKEQTSCDLDGESVVLDMSSGKYYGLNSVGSEVWNLIQQPRTVRAGIRRLCSSATATTPTTIREKWQPR